MFLFVLLLLTDIAYYQEYKEIVDNETCHLFSKSENVPYESNLEEGYCVEHKDTLQNITRFELKNKTHDCDSKVECINDCEYKDFINESFSGFSYTKCVSLTKSPSLPPYLPPPPEENVQCDEYEFKPYSLSVETDDKISVFQDTKLFKELTSDDYDIDNNTIINKCCKECFDETFCYGFGVIVKERNVTCNIVHSRKISFEHTSQHLYKEKFAYMRKRNIPPPPLPPPPPTVTITPVEWYFTFLQPEVLIPSIIGTILLLIVFIYLFRECTNERATALSSIIDSLLGRQKTEVIIA